MGKKGKNANEHNQAGDPAAGGAQSTSQPAAAQQPRMQSLETGVRNLQLGSQSSNEARRSQSERAAPRVNPNRQQGSGHQNQPRQQQNVGQAPAQFSRGPPPSQANPGNAPAGQNCQQGSGNAPHKQNRKQGTGNQYQQRPQQSVGQAPAQSAWGQPPTGNALSRQQRQQGSENRNQPRPQQNFGQATAQAAWRPPAATGAVPRGQPTSSQQPRDTSQASRASSSSVVHPSSPKKNQYLQTNQALQLIESSPDGSKYEGTKGKPIKLEANYLKLDVSKLLPTAYHYDVKFDPIAPKKFLPNALSTFMQTYFKGFLYAFDNRSSFYTNHLLVVDGTPIEGQREHEETVTAVLGDRSKDFKVKIKFAAEIDLSVLHNFWHSDYQRNERPSTAIQCLDVILRTAFKSLIESRQAVNAGRALYFPNSLLGRPDLGEGMELWLGLFQSAVLGRRSLYLNVDAAHKAFPSAIPILDILASFTRDKRRPEQLDYNLENKLNEYLRMLTIEYQSGADPPKTFGYNGLVPNDNGRGFKSARTAIFVSNGEHMSIQEYFRRKGTTLSYPDLPVLHVGSRARTIYLPLELCRISAGQATNRKLTPNCVSKMIKFSATSTDERKRKIMDLLKRIDYASDNGVKGFGIDVEKGFQNVNGRIIDPPSIKYKDSNARPSKGAWNGGNFIETQMQPIKWAIINCDPLNERGYGTKSNAINNLSKLILNQAGRQGMQLAPFNMTSDSVEINMMRPRPNELEKEFDRLSKSGYKLVFVVIIDRNDCYAKVKQAAELRVGILTQCIKAFTLEKRMNDQTMGNILLKVNAKLGGKNHEVKETSYNNFSAATDDINAESSGVMFVGADVTHPSPDARDIPSVVGVAASHDQVGFRYNCAWRLQSPKEEMIQDLENILFDQLDLYKQKNGKLPAKLMYYRDGVSDGQFGQVLEVELAAIRRALKRHYGQNEEKHAKVTFIVVQKRHHTRFFPTDRNSGDGSKNNNIPAGTVVDQDIVHPFQYQFFMASHAAIQGVTKPAKYCVLINESNIKPDDLQAITYDLCHLFTRCNRSVSYPAPTYYAHLVAARGKVYTIGSRINLDRLQNEFNSRKFAQNFIQQCPMFFV